MQALGFLSDPAQITSNHLYTLKGELAGLCKGTDRQIVMQTYEVGVVDGYSSTTASQALRDFRYIHGYYSSTDIVRVNGEETPQITLHGPDNVALRIDQIILPKCMQTLTCNTCKMHNPESDLGVQFCNKQETRRMISQVEVQLAEHVDTKKPYLIALLPVSLTLYQVWAFWQKEHGDVIAVQKH